MPRYPVLIPVVDLPSLEFRIAQSGVGWKGEESETVQSIPSADIKWVQWLRVARNYQIRVALKDGTRTAFDGFSKDVSLFGHMMYISPPPILFFFCLWVVLICVF